MNPTFQRDVNKVFFTDFSQRINFCGIRLDAVITQKHFNPKITGKNIEGMDANTIVRAGIKVSIKSKDFPVSLKVGEEVTVNSKEYIILDIINRLGIVHFYLQKFDSRSKE